MKTKHFIPALFCAALLAGCSHNEYGGADIAGSKLVVKGSISGASSARVSDSGTDWTLDDQIGVSDAGSNLNVLYTATTTTGDFESESGIYVLGSSDVTYTAYYPYTGSEGTEPGDVEFSVVDASGYYVGNDAVDFLWATTTASRSNPTASFVFEHKMTKVTLTVSASASASAVARDAGTVTITLKNVPVDGTFNTETGVVTVGTTLGDVTFDATLGEAASVILPAYSDSTDDPSTTEYTVIVTINGSSYAGTFTPGLVSGYEYGYTVSLSETDAVTTLNISGATITGWNDVDEGSIEVSEVEVENVLEVGDFLCLDGTILDKSTTDADKLADAVAVVYYVGDPHPSVMYSSTYSTTEDLLLTDYPDCTNGLALSLEQVSSAFASDVTQDYSLMYWFNENTPEGIYPAGYTTTDYSSYSSNASGRTNFLGYNNTCLWQQMAEANGVELPALTELDTFQDGNAVEGASSWFIPSAGELTSLVYLSDDGIYTLQDNIAAAIANAGTTEISSSYWSSTDGRYYNDTEQVMIVNTKIGSEGTSTLAPSVANANKSYRLRFAIAF